MNLKFECVKIERTKQQHNIFLQRVENGKQIGAVQMATMQLEVAQQFIPGGFYELTFTEVPPDKV